MNRLRLDRDARAGAAERLSTGSAAVANHLWERAAVWVARGRRDDLDGWRAALGPVARASGLAGALFVACLMVRALPLLLAPLTALWCWLAWRRGDDQRGAAPKDRAEAEREALRGLLLELMKGGSAVHLRTVLAHLQEHGQWEGRTVTDMRLRLERLGVPVDRNVKVRGVPTWGVRRTALEAPSPDAAQETSSVPSTGV
ncbi:hypothetical protein [Streptomyces sp. CC224B]|uniref:hypothetical protein n=1 Tax=Streptomyces sp. CC224B TaxID=3044571 RepID=UPI0024A91461|nr:hypothetical protein [Streptomyces sp. CC224B]